MAIIVAVGHTCHYSLDEVQQLPEDIVSEETRPEIEGSAHEAGSLHHQATVHATHGGNKENLERIQGRRDRPEATVRKST
jgi:hypothetical protein